MTEPALGDQLRDMRDVTVAHEGHDAIHRLTDSATRDRESGIAAIADARWEAHHHEHREAARAEDKAAEAMGVRLESMNEFRDQLKDQATKFITRDEYGTAHGALGDRVGSVDSALGGRIAALETVRYQNEGKSTGQQPFLSVVFYVVSVVLAAAVVHVLDVVK